MFWRSWARVIRGRLPAIGRPNAEILHHGPPPAYARGQAAAGWQVALAAAKFARLRTLDWTLVVGLACRPLEVPPPLDALAAEAPRRALRTGTSPNF